MRSYALLACVAVLLVSGSCVTSKKPLSDPAEGKFDPRLLGSWKMETKEPGEDSGKQTFLHFGKFENVAGLDWGDAVFVQTAEKSGEIRMFEYLGFVSDLNGKKYLNASAVRDIESLQKEKDKHKVCEALDQYFLVKYELRDGRLHLWLSDNKYVQEEIKKGNFTGNGFVLDDSSENVANLLAQHEAEIFVHEAVFVRVP